MIIFYHILKPLFRSCDKLNFFHPTEISEAVSRRFPVKKVVLKNFAKFTEKHQRQSLFFNKVAGLRPEKFLKTPFFIEHLWWLLLKIPDTKNQKLLSTDSLMPEDVVC